MGSTATGAGRAGTPRRTVLAMGSLGAVGAAAAVSGCAVYGDQPDPPPPPDGGGGGTPVIGTADVPVGGGVINADLGVVVTQPSEGEFKGFSATCTHLGCTVAEVTDGTINCPCHGSRFSVENGGVVQAAQGLSVDEQDPLPEVGIQVAGNTVTLS